MRCQMPVQQESCPVFRSFLQEVRHHSSQLLPVLRALQSRLRRMRPRMFRPCQRGMFRPSGALPRVLMLCLQRPPCRTWVKQAQRLMIRSCLRAARCSRSQSPGLPLLPVCPQRARCLQGRALLLRPRALLPCLQGMFLQQARRLVRSCLRAARCPRSQGPGARALPVVRPQWRRMLQSDPRLWRERGRLLGPVPCLRQVRLWSRGQLGGLLLCLAPVRFRVYLPRGRCLVRRWRVRCRRRQFLAGGGFRCRRLWLRGGRCLGLDSRVVLGFPGGLRVRAGCRGLRECTAGLCRRCRRRVGLFRRGGVAGWLCRLACRRGGVAVGLCRRGGVEEGRRGRRGGSRKG